MRDLFYREKGPMRVVGFMVEETDTPIFYTHNYNKEEEALRHYSMLNEKKKTTVYADIFIRNAEFALDISGELKEVVGKLSKNELDNLIQYCNSRYGNWYEEHKEKEEPLDNDFLESIFDGE